MTKAENSEKTSMLKKIRSWFWDGIPAARRRIGARRRFLLLVLVMVGVCSFAMTVMTMILYQHNIREHGELLQTTAQSQARLIEAVARYDARNTPHPEYNSVEQTIGQVVDAHERYRGFGETGEFTLARRDGESIVFVLRHRHGDVERPPPTPFDSDLAEPMRRALNGRSGIVKGLDYRGEMVLAAHEPVDILNLGIVAKIDLAEVRAPFVAAGLSAAAMALIVILIGAAMFFRIGHPIIERLEAYSHDLEVEIEERKRAEAALRRKESKYRTFFENSTDAMLIIENGEFVDCNDAAVAMLGYDQKEEITHTHPSKRSPEFQPDGQPSATKADEMMRLAKERGSHRFEWDHLRKDGTVVPVSVSLTAIETGSGIQLHTVWRDLTKRKRAEEETERARAFLQEVIDGIPEELMVINRDYTIAMANRKAREMTGSDLAQGCPRCHQVSHHSETPCEDEEHPCPLAEVIETRQPVLVEHVHYDANDQKIIVEVVAAPIFDDNGEVVQIIESSRDVTERKLAEDALLESERRFKALHNATFGGIAIHDKGLILDCNRGLAETTGYSTEELIGMDGLLLIAEEMRDLVMSKILSGDENPYEAIGLRKNGEEYPLRLAARNIPYRGKDVRVEEFRDITERKQAEAALTESVQKLALHVEQTPLGVVGWNKKFETTEWNPAAEKIFGYTQGEALGQPASFIIPDIAREQVGSVLANLLENTGGTRSTNENITKDGKIIICDWYNTSLVDDKGSVVGVASLVMDITERKRAEEEREELELQLRQAQKMEAVGQMAGGIAHDFNNLLQVIGGYAELSQMNLADDDPNVTAIREIDKAARRGKDLINQLLAFSRRQVIRPIDLDLNETIDSVLKMIHGLIGEHIEFDRLAGRNLGTVHADAGMIEQVLTNLCVNARDAMPNGGKLTIETENVLIDGNYARTHTWATPGRYVLLSVTDTGCGIAPQALDRIFEPFFTTKEVGKGTGLGLAMVFGIIKQHHGHIHVYSELGKGTIFKIYLPTVERQATEVSRTVPGPVVGGTETILIAEDDETVLELAAYTLKVAGYTVLTAKDGEEAVRVFEAHADELDALVFDVVMPRLGGKEALDRILAQHPGLPHLFTSGYSENAVHTNFIQKRGLHLLGKPYQAEALLRKVREVLDEK